MNISTGGPHILLFERDQQLAALLVSELQLAGYECHIARTAVEVFDAIARFPVRIVLINLAQAAASRREFWVALDTQRRGSGIQVFTFHCSNLASYGPRDPDDYSQASMADMEIDGMLGLMKLVDTVRARVPGGDGTATTMPRVPRASSESQINDNTSGSVRSRMTGTSLPQPPMNTTTNSPSMSALQGTSQSYLPSPSTQLPAGDQATYSDKIRAVLYPNPHSPNPHAWNPSENNNTSPRHNSYVESDATKSYAPQPNPAPAVSPEISALQRLANGQIYSSPGLAELSRLVNGGLGGENPSFAYESWRSPSINISTQAVPQPGNLILPNAPPVDSRSVQSNDPLGLISSTPPLPAQQSRPAQVEPTMPNNYQSRPAQVEPTMPNNYQPRPAQVEPTMPNNYQPRPAQVEPTMPNNYQSRPAQVEPTMPNNYQPRPAQVEPTMPNNYQPRPAQVEPTMPNNYQPRPAQVETATSELQERDHQLRASPIQDLPLERSGSSQVGHAVATKSPDGVSRPKETRPRSIEPQSISQPLQSQFSVQSPVSTFSGLNVAPSVPSQSVESVAPIPRENRAVPLNSESLDRRESIEYARRSDRSEERRGNLEPARRSDRSEERRGNLEPAHQPDRSEERRGNLEPARQSDRSEERRGNLEPARRSDRSEERRGNLEPARQSDRSEERRGNLEPARRSDRSEERRGNLEPARQSDRSEERRGNLEPARQPDRSEERRGNLEPARQSDRSEERRDNLEYAQQPDRLAERRESLEYARRPDRSEEMTERREILEYARQPDRSEEVTERWESRRSDRAEAPFYQDIQQSKEIDEVDAQNAVILDILQSLPAIAKPSGQQEQAVQPQIHNGRATRSLGNVLLDGHLVPPDRLDVAQSIQRMLRGVDLNYQLGEILLMFKLLTPDQLLAANLLSYGLITTTQISALGRIRQELHAIGLDYDLENLVILFRILSPEQLREARSSMQG